MIRISRPTAGRFSLSLPKVARSLLLQCSPKGTLPCFVACVSTGFIACAPKEDKLDTWKLTPPTIEMTNSRGVVQQLKAGERVSSAMPGPFAGESIALRFAPADRGFAVTIRTECAAGELKTDEFKSTHLTSEQLNLLGALPPLTLAPPNLKRDWLCDIKLSVINDHGSRSSGEFRKLPFNFSALAARFANSNLELKADNLSRRINCPSWWSDGVGMDLDAISHASVVGGTDTRKIERQPLCSVSELGTSTKLLGFYRPVFSGNRFTVMGPQLLFAPGRLIDLYHRKLFSWTIRNDETFVQSFFIQAAPHSVRFAPFLNGSVKSSYGLLDPVRMFPKFSAMGAIEARQTSAGYYFRVGPGTTVNLEMSSGHPATDNSGTMFTLASHLVVTVEAPIHLISLANDNNIPSLATAGDGELDNSPRDGVSLGATALLASSVFEISGGVFIPSKTTAAELAARGKVAGTDCMQYLPDGSFIPLTACD